MEHFPFADDLPIEHLDFPLRGGLREYFLYSDLLAHFYCRKMDVHSCNYKWIIEC